MLFDDGDGDGDGDGDACGADGDRCGDDMGIVMAVARVIVTEMWRGARQMKNVPWQAEITFWHQHSVLKPFHLVGTTESFCNDAHPERLRGGKCFPHRPCRN